MLTVNDLMTVNPYSVSPNTSLRRVIELLKTEGCRQFPVMDNDKLVGVITDRDIRLVINSPMMAEGHAQNEELLDTLKVDSCMTANPMSVTPETPGYRAAKMLSLYKFGALPVIDDDRLVGIITVSDFLDYFSAGQAETIIEGS